MTLKTEDGVIVLTLKTGIEVEIHPNDSLTINTPQRTWDAGLRDGNLILDGLERRGRGQPVRGRRNHSDDPKPQKVNMKGNMHKL